MQQQPNLEPARISEARVFQNREDAGRQLARAIRTESLEEGVVVGLARGGVVVAAPVARVLDVPLDALAVRKVGYPWQPEYGLGAVTPEGGLYLRTRADLSNEEIEQVVATAREKAEELDRRLHDSRPPVPVHGKTCVLVDDGLATGATMFAAVKWARSAKAKRVIVAVPVGAPETVAKLEAEADRVICLEAPEVFLAVGMWYSEFTQVTDDEVVALLEAQAASERRGRYDVEIAVDGSTLAGELTVPEAALGVVVFAHGSGSSRFSPRNTFVARRLNTQRIATLLLDLLTPAEEVDRANVFDVELLAERLAAATNWLEGQSIVRGLPVGYFGASTGAAAALWAAASQPSVVSAVVSRGGRPDLAGPKLPDVESPTLLIVGGNDEIVLDLNAQAAEQLQCKHELSIVPGATHLFEEPGALEGVSELAAAWFSRSFDKG